MFTLIHFISKADIEYLEQKFAILTEDGWVIPQWIKDLEQTIQSRSKFS